MLKKLKVLFDNKTKYKIKMDSFFNEFYVLKVRCMIWMWYIYQFYKIRDIVCKFYK